MAQNLLLLLKIDFRGNEGRRGSRGRGTEWGGWEDLPNGGWDLEALIKTLSQNALQSEKTSAAR